MAAGRSPSVPFRQVARTTPALPAQASRSAVTNGALLPQTDNREAWRRRVRDLIEIHVADLGGHDAVSQAEMSILRRAAVLTTELERLEAKLADAEEPQATTLDLYQRAAGNLRRLLATLGLQRRPRTVTPTLNEYLVKKGEAL